MENLSRKDLTTIIQQLMRGAISRDDVADWASELVFNESFQAEDEVIWDLLNLLMSVNLTDDNDEYLYQTDDFRIWLEVLNS